ncbi:hypothetical protein AB5N19_01088 [Seiridium cardinale]
MEDTISRALDGFRLSDGEPDRQARKTSLVSFVQQGCLDVNEYRLLKELLSRVTLQKDIVRHLPVELILLITSFLSVRDISSCLMVSRGWNALFMNHRIIFSLADRLFPQLTWIPSRERVQDESTRLELRRDFLRHLRKRLSHMDRSAQEKPRAFDKNYVWSAETEFTLDGQEYSQFPVPNLPSNRRAVYGHGRIAWQRETHTLVVDDLRTKLRKILALPGGRLMGPEMMLAAIGNKLVVAVMNRHIFAWDIETSRSERKTLPSLPTQCTTFGDRVAIITSKEIYMWKVGGSILPITLPVPHGPRVSNQFPKAFVHPHLEKVIFARQVYRSSPSTLRFIIHKFIGDSHVGTFNRDVEMNWSSAECVSSSLEGFIPLTHVWNQPSKSYQLYEFDIYHEKFSKRSTSYGGGRHNDAVKFIFDDDFAVELSEGHYRAW